MSWQQAAPMHITTPHGKNVQTPGRRQLGNDLGINDSVHDGCPLLPPPAGCCRVCSAAAAWHYVTRLCNEQQQKYRIRTCSLRHLALGSNAGRRPCAALQASSQVHTLIDTGPQIWCSMCCCMCCSSQYAAARCCPSSPPKHTQTQPH